jgi:membrane AbrB-like protein
VAFPGPTLTRLVGERPQAGRWAILVVLSLAVVLPLRALHLPASTLVGPMIAAIAVAVADGRLDVPLPAFWAAQGVVGCLIAHNIPPSTASEVLRSWPLFVLGVAAVLAASLLVGWLLARWQVLPGTAAIWGAAPGAATSMVLLAEDFGADVRLVAFMQYLRVACVASVASVVARLAGPVAGPVAVPAPAVLEWLPVVETLAVAGVGAALARRVRIPGGALLVPLVAGVALQGTGTLSIALPSWVLIAAYAVLGWGIGLRFTPDILGHAARAFPRLLVSIFALIGMCALVGAALVLGAGIDPLTAYLATSPGGADSVAIIAASGRVDAPFVMAMQTTRFLAVLAFGPALSRLVARRLTGKA